MNSQRFFLTILGSRLHIERLSPPEKRGQEVLIFLHDALGSIPQWRDFPALLSSRCGREAIVYERVGYGHSSPLRGKREADYLEREAQEYLPRLLAALGVEHPVLFGHSDGGTIALLYAANHRPAAIITEAAHVFVEKITLAGIQQAIRQKESLITRLRRYHGKKTETLFAAWADIWLNPGFHEWDITAVLPDIRCPALILQGTDDEYGTAAQVQAIADGIGKKAVTHLISGCGHVPHRENPEEILEIVSSFLSKNI